MLLLKYTVLSAAILSVTFHFTWGEEKKSKKVKNAQEKDTRKNPAKPIHVKTKNNNKKWKEAEQIKNSIEEFWFSEGEEKAENLTCNKPLDLVIALDSSESIREANWSKLIRFTKAVVKTLDPTLTRVSVIRYNTNAEVPIPLGFFQSSDAFGTTLDNVFYEPGGTRTDVALSKALAVFASGGKRRASKVLLVVTDNPTNDIRLSKDSLVIGRDLVEKPSESLKSYEVITFGVGINYGLTATEQTDLKDELKMFTLDPAGDKRVVEVQDFDGLLQEANNVAGKICLVNGGWSSWSPWSQCTASCGGGTKVRLRRCDNPKPVNNGTNCTELSGSTVETAACNIYPCTDGLEVTSLRPLPFHPARGTAQNILFSKDCPNGFDYVLVDNNQMSASSVYTKDTGDPTILKLHGPGNGRLYNIMNAGAWCAEHSESVSNNQDQYIQIDLKLPIKIGKVGTQGQASLISNNWVSFYKFNYSEDGRTWKQYNQVSAIHDNSSKSKLSESHKGFKSPSKSYTSVRGEWLLDGKESPSFLFFQPQQLLRDHLEDIAERNFFCDHNLSVQQARANFSRYLL